MCPQTSRCLLSLTLFLHFSLFFFGFWLRGAWYLWPQPLVWLSSFSKLQFRPSIYGIYFLHLGSKTHRYIFINMIIFRDDCGADRAKQAKSSRHRFGRYQPLVQSTKRKEEKKKQNERNKRWLFPVDHRHIVCTRKKSPLFVRAPLAFNK